jgi:hypothetical protein
VTPAGSPRLWALSDLHVGAPPNRAAVDAFPAEAGSALRQDWLVLAGDIGERPEDVAWTVGRFRDAFARVLWVPGNHELWTVEAGGPRGLARYEAHVAAVRAVGGLTPEDPWPLFPGTDHLVRVCPLFLLYDYSFAPGDPGPAAAVTWAREQGVRATDEVLLHPDPYPSRAAWCAARVAAAEARLAALDPGERTVLVNHWPLRQDLVRIPRVPAYAPWCGTRATTDWGVRFRAEVVVSGHLHVRATDWREGVRYEEVSVGYPRDWTPARGLLPYLRAILPGPPAPPEPAATLWRREPG